MPLATFTCDPKSHYANRIAYNNDTKQFWIEFKPKMTVYRYEGVPGHHFDNVVFAKARFAEWVAANPDANHEEPPKDESGAKLGSEGSYLIAHVVGKDRKNPLFVFRRLEGDEAAEIFPFAGAAAA